VLTTDELKNFVDAKVPAISRAPKETSSFGQASDPAKMLRDLLARRLMRDGRYGEALPYFGDVNVRAGAKVYADALHDASSDWWDIDRARAYYTAAALARASGMEMMGTEGAPDYENVGGDYDCCIGQDDPKGPYVTAGEQARAKASTAAPNLRYHYRYVAVDEANRAADLLPPRSQAYAAVLCKATAWMFETSEVSRAHALYMRYVKNGAHVAWGRQFGQKCPEPDFARAVALKRTLVYRHWRHYASVHRWWLAGVLLIFVAAGAFGAVRAHQRGAFAKFGAWVSEIFRRKNN